jgi:hypothetical protein
MAHKSQDTEVIGVGMLMPYHQVDTKEESGKLRGSRLYHPGIKPVLHHAKGKI